MTSGSFAGASTCSGDGRENTASVSLFQSKVIVANPASALAGGQICLRITTPECPQIPTRTPDVPTVVPDDDDLSGGGGKRRKGKTNRKALAGGLSAAAVLAVIAAIWFFCCGGDASVSPS